VHSGARHLGGFRWHSAGLQPNPECSCGGRGPANIGRTDHQYIQSHAPRVGVRLASAEPTLICLGSAGDSLLWTNLAVLPLVDHGESAQPQGYVRSYARRGGRLGPQLLMALAHTLPQWRTPEPPWRLDQMFPHCDRYVLEIGSGMGEATLAMAAMQPTTGLIAVEVHDRGVAALARGVDQLTLTNVRIHDGDAIAVLSTAITEPVLHEIRVWFPDPWPKTRHHKRRIISPEFVTLAVSRLVVGGVLHVATDHREYADHIAEVLTGSEDLDAVVVRGPRPKWRPVTKFESAGLRDGRRPADFIFARR